MVLRTVNTIRTRTVLLVLVVLVLVFCSATLNTLLKHDFEFCCCYGIDYCPEGILHGCRSCTDDTHARVLYLRTVPGTDSISFLTTTSLCRSTNSNFQNGCKRLKPKIWWLTHKIFVFAQGAAKAFSAVESR